MTYVAEIVCTKSRTGFASAWAGAMEGLACLPGFLSGELFEMKRDVRNAHYDFVSIIKGSDELCMSDAFMEGSTPHRLEPVERAERVVCDLEVLIDNAPHDEKNCVWLVNPFEVTCAQIPDVLEMWDKAKDHLIAKAGFVDARLFRARAESARYGLINIARWRSAELFDAALADRAYDKHRERARDYTHHSSLCARVAFVQGDYHGLPTRAGQTTTVAP